MTDSEKINKAVDLILKYGHFDGAHHKDWVLDQTLRVLMAEEAYKNMREELEKNDCWYEEGIAP